VTASVGLRHAHTMPLPAHGAKKVERGGGC
jgi:hypothetical protein